MHYLESVVMIGCGATAVMDLGALARARLFGTSFPNYGYVGRWIGWMGRGRFSSSPISAAPALPGERFIGWTVHYLVGMPYAALLLALWGLEWLRQPSLLPALIVGIGTVAAPFLVMQPGMGLGIAANRTPNPSAVRIQSLTNHAVFGMGLYLSGWAVSVLSSP